MVTLPRVKISVIGCGYLGAVHAASMAELGHDVVGIDVDQPKVEALQHGKAPFYEPGFDELLTATLASGRLPFSADFAAAADAQVHFVCVGTPQKRGEYAADLRYVEAAVESLLAVLRPGDARRREVDRAGRHGRPAGRAGRGRRCPARCWPGTRSSCARASPSQDTLHPDRLVYGLPAGDDGDTAHALLDEVYAPIVADGTPAGRHRLRHRRDGEDRGQLLPRHEDLVHQRDGRAVRGHRRRREAAGRRDRLRRPDRPQVPQRRPRLRRRLPAQGHPRVHGPGRRAGRRPGADLPARGRQHQHAPPDPDGGAGPRGLRRHAARQAGRRARARRSSRTATTSATRRR